MTFIDVGVGVLVAALLFAVLKVAWAARSLRPQEPGFRYVYVNNRGRAREVCAEERTFLSQEFELLDGGRPAILLRYEKVDATEFKSGYIERRCLPPEVEIIKLTPEEEIRKDSDPVSINQTVFEDRCSRLKQDGDVSS